MQDLFEQIESPETAARLGANSGFRHFLGDLGTDPAVREIAIRIRRDPQAVNVLFKRLTRLAETQIDARYEHPSDTALAAYLLVLSLADEGLHRTAAAIVSSVPNTWWARKVAETRRRDTQSAAEAIDVATPAQHRNSRQPPVVVESESYESAIAARITYDGRLIRSDARQSGDADTTFTDLIAAATRSTAATTTPTNTVLSLAA